MQLHTFVAESAPDAISQIREQLGPEAVVLSVRKLPAPGLGRLWQRPRIEVLACVPEKTPAPPDSLGEIKSQLAELRQQFESRKEFEDAIPPMPIASKPVIPAEISAPELDGRPSIDRSPAAEPGMSLILENMGILPLYAQRVMEQMRLSRKDPSHQSVAQQIELASATLGQMWRGCNAPASNVHIFIGPPGSGKTTCLCKWIAKAVLLDNRLARVWRLDGTGPNTAESLSVYAEILGVTLERFATGLEDLNPAELLFIDLPGVNWRDADALDALARQIKDLPGGHVHLVLNAAYETSLLMTQARAFSSFPITDFVITHLDEETQWGKLWNLVLGTNYSIGFLGAGQNIPGEFHAASAQLLFKRQFSYK